MTESHHIASPSDRSRECTLVMRICARGEQRPKDERRVRASGDVDPAERLRRLEAFSAG